MKILSLKKGMKNYYGLIAATSVIILVLSSYFYNSIITESVLSSAIRQSTPLILGALCGLLCERSGVMNIGIEGQMLFSAFIGFLVNVWSGNLFLAILSGLMAGAFSGFILAFMSVSLRVDQIISGTVINIMAIGVTGFFYQVGLSAKSKLLPLSIPFLSEIPLLGPVIFKTPPITLFTIFMVIFLQFLLFRTKWGLRTRAVGEHPKAADTTGVNVFYVQYSRIVTGGLFAGLAGVFLSLEAVGTFERGMTNGRGFIALAVMIFGKWTPLGSWGAALLFGFVSALQTQLQFSGEITIPHQFIGMLPYLVTIIVLSFFSKRNRPPRSLGIPYEKE